MDKFKIFETNQFLKELAQNFSGQQQRLERKLTIYVYPQLRENLYFGKNIKKLKDYKPETWRYRIGAYRFFYEIDEKKKLVSMITIDSREDAYRR